MNTNKKHHFLFFSFLGLCSFFNAGNSNIYIQINFILISIIFFISLKNKNYVAHLKTFVYQNKISCYFFLLFILYLVFQLIPLPTKTLEIFSNEKFNLLQKIESNSSFFPLSFSSTDTYFQIINYITVFISLLVVKMIFYNNRSIHRFYYFLTFLGALHACLAVFLYLNGNPDFFFLSSFHYKDSSTGLFVNRTVFSIFLIFCLICGLEYLKNVVQSDLYKNRDNFFHKIYVRIFIIFITLGIITTFSKLGNFLMFLTILFYLFHNFFIKRNKNKMFSLILILIIFLDVFILGFYFGGDKLIGRFMFLSDNLTIDASSRDISRLEIINFSFNQFKNYLIFGYGAGGFENIFKLNFINSYSLFANHVHSDIIEFLGEFGIFGFTFFILSFSAIFFRKSNYSFKFNLLLTIGTLIILFDFSLHIPLIQILFVILITFSLNIKKNNFTQFD